MCMSRFHWYNDRHNCTLQFDVCFNDLDLHSRSQDYGKIELVLLFHCKVHDMDQTFAMVSCLREMTIMKSFMVNLDHLSICTACVFFLYSIISHPGISSFLITLAKSAQLSPPLPPPPHPPPPNLSLSLCISLLLPPSLPLSLSLHLSHFSSFPSFPAPPPTPSYSLSQSVALSFSFFLFLFLAKKNFRQRVNVFQTWQTRYMLLLWLSMVCKIPFDLRRLDSNVPAGDGASKQPVMERILGIAQVENSSA